MTTWSQSIHHPWFDRSPLKRKLSSTDDERRSSPYQRSSPSPTSRAKRRKFSTLEHGFAHLSLTSALVQPNLNGLLITPIIHPTVSSSEYPPTSVVLPGSVEEPPHELEASAPEVSMEYDDEREHLSDTRMAFVDSDILAACAKPDNSHDEAPGSPRFSISTPFLEGLRKRQMAPQLIIPISSADVDGGALVLYRPLRPPSPSPTVNEQAESIQEVVTSEAAALIETLEPVPIDDDAMDVE